MTPCSARKWSATDESVQGVEVYTLVDGMRVDATSPGMPLHHDSARYGHAGYALASLTHNFILPAHANATAKVELWLNASRVEVSSARRRHRGGSPRRP